MNISETSERVGLPVKTIRYYEDIGLVKPGRTSNGYRVFSDNDTHMLTFLGRARALGFGIDDCRTLLALYQDKTRASADVKQIAQEHLAQIEQKLADLEAMRATLSELIGSCAGDGRPDCPILHGLSIKT